MHPASNLEQYGVEVERPVWRISLKKYPLFSSPPAVFQTYGRFDDPSTPERNDTEAFSVLYCAHSPIAAFIESMSGMRTRLGAVQELTDQTLISVDERETTNAMQEFAGVVSRDWQEANHLTSANAVTFGPVFDLATAEAVQSLRIQLAPLLIAMGLDDLDFGELLGSNRTLTQAISRWVWSMKSGSGQPLFSGIRYRSRFDPECICLALYEDRYSIDGDVDILPITPETPGFADAGSILRLTIA